MTTVEQVAAISPEVEVPIALTAGGSKDSLFVAEPATLTGHEVSAMFDPSGPCGKAACLGIHPT